MMWRGARYRVIPGPLAGLLSSFSIFRRTTISGGRVMACRRSRVFRYGGVNSQACTRGSQGRQDSNLHVDTVLETAALPLSYVPGTTAAIRPLSCADFLSVMTTLRVFLG